MKLENGMAAVVTGGASGLGRASAQALADQGLKELAVKLVERNIHHLLFLPELTGYELLVFAEELTKPADHIRKILEKVHYQDAEKLNHTFSQIHPDARIGADVSHEIRISISLDFTYDV